MGSPDERGDPAVRVRRGIRELPRGGGRGSREGGVRAEVREARGSEEEVRSEEFVQGQSEYSTRLTLYHRTRRQVGRRQRLSALPSAVSPPSTGCPDSGAPPTLSTRPSVVT